MQKYTIGLISAGHKERMVSCVLTSMMPPELNPTDPLSEFGLDTLDNALHHCTNTR